MTTNLTICYSNNETIQTKQLPGESRPPSPLAFNFMVGSCLSAKKLENEVLQSDAMNGTHGTRV